MDWAKLIGLSGPGRESTGLGPDFPSSSGDREKGKFRESGHARLTQVAVCDDNGEAISTVALAASLEETNRLLHHLIDALVVNGVAAEIKKPYSHIR